MYHAVKITNNVRADTRGASLALDDASETVPRHIDVHATIDVEF
jgi:hypothetical protein